jgi:formamidopyrimidine-DNA glycosylase
MPELPEVETIRRSLAAHLIGGRITAVQVRERRLRKEIAPGFELALIGRRIEALERRGKYLLVGLDDGKTLLVHLGMSGSLTIGPANGPFDSHDHVRLDLDSGRALTFNDPRRFGLMRLGALDEMEELHNVGDDSLALSWSAEQWRAALRGRRLPIKNLLMDQRLLAGIGNIYANEMLYRAGIRPRRRADRLKRDEIARLARAVREVLARAVRLGGSSISDFRDGNGRPGEFQIHHAVYDRAGAPCRRCGATIRKVVLSGRSSFYCPSCQR